MKIDITMISTIRPEIVRRTLQSLVKYLKNPDGFKLIIDIAPVGEMDKTQDDIAKIAGSCFEEIIARTNLISYQAEALIWTWQQAGGEFILNWEDDWEVMQNINISQLISVFNEYPKLAAINFDREGKHILTYQGYKGQFFPIPGKDIYQRKTGYSLGGPPAIIRKEYIKEALNYISPVECLDITSQKAEVRKFLDTWDHATIARSNSAYVKDIGHQWKKEHGIKRIKDSKVGVQWVKIN